jgi:murein DD-endopeptidase MepM/ murein hydrolase activator NlpD
MHAEPPITISETFGLSPIAVRAKETWLAIRGGEQVPPTRFDRSSLGVFMPRLSVKTYLGWRRPDRRVPIYNLFNRTPTPLSDGWSVRKTQIRDFRGGTLTYDSHNGTDFIVPIGTLVVAPAPAKVIRVSSEFNRGGLKVFLDHGDGLITTSNHLARSLVRVGDVVARGQPIALSGYSGLDGLSTFPIGAPHIHFNVWLDGEYVDPFAVPGEASIWRDGNEPRPSEGLLAERFEPTKWDPKGVSDAIDACTSAASRDEIAGFQDFDERAAAVLFHRNYYPTRFSARPPLAEGGHARTPRLTLPLSPDDYVGVAFDGLGG